MGMGGTSYTDGQLSDAVLFAETKIYSLCKDARIEMGLVSGSYSQCLATLLGKLQSDYRDYIAFQLHTFDVQKRFTSIPDPDSAAAFLSSPMEDEKEAAEVSTMYQSCKIKGRKLSKRCQREVKVIEMSLRNIITNNNTNAEEFYEIHGVHPDSIFQYFIPRLYSVTSNIMRLRILNEEFYCSINKQMKLKNDIIGVLTELKEIQQAV